MPEIEPCLADDGTTLVSPPSPRTALFWDGTHWHVPRVDDHGRVQVRGEDQLHSFGGVLANTKTSVISGADGWGDSLACPGGTIWHVTAITVCDVTTPTTRMYLQTRHNGVSYSFDDQTLAVPLSVNWSWTGDLWLDSGDTIRAYFIGGLVGDSLRVRLHGEIMTLET